MPVGLGSSLFCFRHAQGLWPPRTIMLGDVLPWFLPLFVFGLLTWIFYEAIESLLRDKTTVAGPKALAALRWMPVVQLLIMLLHRGMAVVQRDLSHIEVCLLYTSPSPRDS